MLGKLLSQLKNIVKKVSPTFLISGYHFGLAFLAALVYGLPARKLKVIGVTGTSGKSTVIEMVSRILTEAGYKTASLSSIRFKIGDREEINDKRLTMPGRFFIQRFLSRAVKAGCQYLVLEVTSEGIVQHRHRFIDFEAAVLTNLSPEHIEAHGGFENYRRAKGRLFEAAEKTHVINLDDENSGFFLKFPAKEKWGYGTRISNFQFPIIKADNVETLTGGSKFVIDGLEFRLKLLGEFNIYNALAAIGTARSQGISLDVCQRALEKVEGLPGRMERVINDPFTVFVDYAITPNALDKVYQTLGQYRIQDARLICVLGSCGGGRDKWKRPIMGQTAAKYCQKIIITNEDSYPGDDFEEIINQVAQGAGEGAEKILDRRQAINKALRDAQKGDIVAITGKGCEPTIWVAGKQIPWDESRVVREEFAKIYAR